MKNWLSRWAARSTSKFFSSGNWQEELDTFRVFLATSYYDKAVRTGLIDSDPDIDTEALISEASKLEYAEQKNFVLDSLTNQVNEMFAYIKETGGMDPYPQPVNEQQGGEIENLLDKVSAHKEKEKRRDFNILEKEIPHWTKKFSLYIRKSNIDHPEAGLGVMVKGTVQPGTVLGVYPGTILFPLSLKKEDVENNDYMIARYDGAIISARDWEKRAAKIRRENNHVALTGLKVDETSPSVRQFRNPFGIMHYVNHPPAGVTPNVICYSYNFSKELDAESKSFICNEYSSKPNIFLDEELYLNYRLNPAFPYPEWYTQPDEEEARRRWGKRQVFQWL